MMRCDECGETFPEDGEIVCPYCGSEEISQIYEGGDLE